uniref:Uncharacterized protein n=1 Tax=Octopus bimaculoides TaxID=37653 RepID=A0A0L8GYL9_OCTBM
MLLVPLNYWQCRHNELPIPKNLLVENSLQLFQDNNSNHNDSNTGTDIRICRLVKQLIVFGKIFESKSTCFLIKRYNAEKNKKILLFKSLLDIFSINLKFFFRLKRIY